MQLTALVEPDHGLLAYRPYWLPLQRSLLTGVMVPGHRLPGRPAQAECGPDEGPLRPGAAGQCAGAGQAAPMERSSGALQGERLPGGGPPLQPEAVPGAAAAPQEGVHTFPWMLFMVKPC